MSDLCSQTMTERALEIEIALSKALELDGIAIEYNQGDLELVVANPLKYEEFYHHNFSAIARDIERRLFPNG